MGLQLPLLFGAASIAAACVTLFLVVSLGSSTVTGVARSLQMIENTVSEEEVARNELPAFDRLINPFFSKMKGFALRLSPSGTGYRLTRLLDRAGNPVGLTVERLLGFKGAGLLLGGLLGLFFGGLSLKGILFGAEGAEENALEAQPPEKETEETTQQQPGTLESQQPLDRQSHRVSCPVKQPGEPVAGTGRRQAQGKALHLREERIDEAVEGRQLISRDLLL